MTDVREAAERLAGFKAAQRKTASTAAADARATVKQWRDLWSPDEWSEAFVDTVEAAAHHGFRVGAEFAVAVLSALSAAPAQDCAHEVTLTGEDAWEFIDRMARESRRSKRTPWQAAESLTLRIDGDGLSYSLDGCTPTVVAQHDSAYEDDDSHPGVPTVVRREWDNPDDAVYDGAATVPLASLRDAVNAAAHHEHCIVSQCPGVDVACDCGLAEWTAALTSAVPQLREDTVQAAPGNAEERPHRPGQRDGGGAVDERRTVNGMDDNTATTARALATWAEKEAAVTGHTTAEVLGSLHALLAGDHEPLQVISDGTKRVRYTAGRYVAEWTTSSGDTAQVTFDAVNGDEAWRVVSELADRGISEAAAPAYVRDVLLPTYKRARAALPKEQT